MKMPRMPSAITQKIVHGGAGVASQVFGAAGSLNVRCAHF